MTSELVFAFDMGKASLGLCARTESDLLEINSFEIPAEFAATEDFRNRRRILRTKQAHKKREDWLIRQWTQAGFAILPPTDEKMKREFPKKGDETLYNSALLRIALIQNRPLEAWQIFKALWAAIQLRGYDSHLPWANNHKKNTKDVEPTDTDLSAEEKLKQQDEIENTKAAEKYLEQVKHAVSPYLGTEGYPDYVYPCFLAANTMGLWSADKPNELIPRITMHAGKVRKKPNITKDTVDPGNVAPRYLVEKELRVLFKNAQKQLPQLAAIDVELFLYGEGREAYASYTNASFLSKRGTEWDAQGVLSQKVPRFDNRIIGKCQLMPTRNVCKANDPLNVDFTLLQKIKNFRFTDADGEINRSLNIEEFREAFRLLKENLNSKASNELTAGQVQKALEKAVGAKIHDLNLADREKVKIRTSGRARFCRPALKLMVDVMLSGQNPPDFDLTPYVQAHAQGVQRPELEKALSRLGSTWDKIHVGDDRDNEIIKQPYSERAQAIGNVIGNVNNPIVRHRLTIFYQQLQRMTQTHGQPRYVVLEFIRGGMGLEGQKTASDWERWSKDNEKFVDKLKANLQELGYPASKTNIDRLRLLREQGGHCLYTGDPLSESHLESYQIDHIVPMSETISSDAMYNKVLCTQSANQQKQDRTPYEWLYGTHSWETYVQRVRDLKTFNGKKKRQLLVASNARELVESYNGLAETAYMARLAQQIVSLHFGWGLQTLGDNRRVFTSSGRETAKIRSVYKLNELLLTPEERANLKLDEKIKKNRSNPKHHALDAYCISYSRSLRPRRKPDGDICWEVKGLERTKEQLEHKLEALFPTPLRRNTKELYPLETIYGYKTRKIAPNKEKHYLTVHKTLVDLLGKDRKKLKDIWDDTIREDLAAKSDQTPDKDAWLKLLSEYTHPLRKSPVKRVLIIETEQDNAPTVDKQGRRSLGEYKDFGKLTQTQGQFKHSKQHKGQIIYFDAKGKAKVQPVYAHQSEDTVREALQQAGYKLYNEGMLFYSGAVLNIPKPFGKALKIYPAGLYKLRTIFSAGPVKLETTTGEEPLSNVQYLVEAGFFLNAYTDSAKLV